MNHETNLRHDLIKPGDHLVVLYRQEEEVVDAVISYLHSAINRNDKCIYITGDANTDLIKDGLAIFYDIDTLIEKNQLIFMDKNDSYSKDGSFVPDLMIKTLSDLSNEAITEGFNGLAVTGEISWVLNIEDGFDKIIEYEWKLNEYVFNHFRISALCRYNMNKFSDERIINLIELHPYIVLSGAVYENPFFIPSEGYLKNNIKKFQVDEMLNNIQKFENRKSEFNRKLLEKEKELLNFQEKMNKELLQALISLLEFHDGYTKRHSNSVANLVGKLCQELGLSEIDTNKAYYASLVHDIGKIVIPKEVLNKKEALSYQEIEVIKKHPETAYKTLSKLESLQEIATIVKHHHERYDGTGYPDFLIKDDIPLLSRVISVVDSFDAMTNDRPYRDAMTFEEAMTELTENKGTQYDPYIVEVFQRMM